MRAPQPLPTPMAVEKEMEVAPATAPRSTPERGALAEAPLPPEEERIEDTTISTTLSAEAIGTAEPAFTPTAVVQVLPPTPLAQEPTGRAAARPGRLGLVLLRVVEASLLSLVLVLAIATLVARRRQGAR
jgi:hypothetical protein